MDTKELHSTLLRLLLTPYSPARTARLKEVKALILATGETYTEDVREVARRAGKG
jgi:hypothetical protein